MGAKWVSPLRRLEGLLLCDIIGYRVGVSSVESLFLYDDADDTNYKDLKDCCCMLLYRIGVSSLTHISL